jgi:NTE family protein
MSVPVTMLAGQAFLRGLEPNEVEALARAGEPRTLAEGAILDAAGEAGAPWLLLEGEIGARARGTVDVEPFARPGAVFLVERDADLALVACGAVKAVRWSPAALATELSAQPGLARQLEVRLSIHRRRAELVDALSRSALFSQTSGVQLRWLVESGTLVGFDPGEYVCEQGGPPDALFLLVRGRVEVEQRLSASEPVQTIATLHAGEVFGEVAMVTGVGRSASVIARTPCEILVVGKREFDSLSHESAAFRRGIRLLSEERTAGDGTAHAPELIWLVNRTRRPTAILAKLVARTIERAFGDRVATLEVTGRAGIGAHDPALRRVGVGQLQAEALSTGADYVLCFTGPDEERTLGPSVARLVSTAACFTTPEDGTPFAVAGLRAAYRVELVDPGRAVRRQGRRGVVLPLGRADIALSGLGVETIAAFERLGRMLTRRVVGLALGGGGAWGFGHVALLRAFHARKIPVDVLAGVSFGSVVGAFYASAGLDGLDELLGLQRELMLSTSLATFSSRSVAWFIRRNVRHQLIEELPLPFSPVAVDIQRGQEKAFRRGSLAEAVRCSGSFPGVFGPTVYEGVRYVDGCVKNNVPASSLIDDGADFIIASNVVPPPRVESTGPAKRGLGAALSWLSPLDRVRDSIRSMYLVVNDVGHRQSSCANLTFEPQLFGFLPADFTKAQIIIDATTRQMGPWLEDAVVQYRNFCRIRPPC